MKPVINSVELLTNLCDTLQQYRLANETRPCGYSILNQSRDTLQQYRLANETYLILYRNNGDL